MQEVVNINLKMCYLSYLMVKYKINYEINPSEYSKVIYGDSVTGDTPLLLMKDGKVYIETIESIFKDSGKVEYHTFKIFDMSFRSNKSYSLSGYKIWSDIGWVNIRKVIRHKCDKKVFKVTTGNGYVKVTEDHSLLTETGKKIKPKDCKFGTRLLASYPSEFQYFDEIQYTGNYLEIPGEILNANQAEIQNFLLKYWGEPRAKSCLSNARLYYLFRKLGYSCENANEIINIHEVHNNIDSFVYDIETECGRFQAGVGDIIVKNTDSCMIELNTKALIKYKELLNDYKDIVKITPEEQENIEKFKTKAIEEAFVQGKVLANQVTKALFKHPINLEFEKVYTNFLILSKKRYLGNYYGKDPYTIDMVEKKGVVLKRRDNPEIVKKVYTGVVTPLLEHGERGISMSVSFLKKELEKLMNNEVNLDDLVVTKSLAKGYGKIDKKGELVIGDNDYKNTNLPHVSLAIKMRERDPGSAPNIGDRINYIFVELPGNPMAKLYEKAEDPKIASESGMKIDYLYYVTNQIQNPVNEILKILISDSDKIFTDAIENYTKNRKEDIRVAKIKSKIPKGQQSILKWIKPKD